MANKFLNTRVIQKHDTEANWLLASGFIPLNGEIIIYDEDDNYNYKRVKIGNGINNINNLPFIINPEELNEIQTELQTLADKVDNLGGGGGSTGSQNVEE